MADSVIVPFSVIAALPGDAIAWVVYGWRTLDPTLTQVAIANVCGVNPGTVRRAEKRLVEAELIQPRTRASARTDDAESILGARADARSGASREPSSPGNELFPTGTPAEPGRAPNPAVDLVKRVWAAKDPRPATPFPAVVKIAERFLDAGWTEEQVEQGLLHAPTISVGWVESWLNRNAKTTRPTRPGPAVDDDRAAPTRRVQL